MPFACHAFCGKTKRASLANRLFSWNHDQSKISPEFEHKQLATGVFVQCEWKRYPYGIRFVQMGKEDSMTTEQITKADRNACHTLCEKGKGRATLRQLSSTVLGSIKGMGIWERYVYFEVSCHNLNLSYLT